MPAEPSQLAAGTMLDDKYRIECLIAFGGMGAVYEGTHIKLRKRVAIKILNPQLATELMIERFHREAITASQIGHEGIAQVTDIGTSTAGEPFLVMEYLEGESLGTRLRTSGALPIEVACELGCAILSPLNAAHLAGIIHRDLKPDNVFLVRQSRGEMVKLLDFGISRTTGHEGEFRLTTTGLILGTPYYMSPEQARGDNAITIATDLYAFGVMLYEMLVGGVPIQGENYNQLMYRVLTGDFQRPRERRPEIPEALEKIILHAMAIQPSERPASAAELEEALLAFCRPTFREHTIERISAARLPSKITRTPPLPSSPAVGTDQTLIAETGPVAKSDGGVGLRARPEPTTGSPASAPARRSRAPIIIGVLAVLGVAAGVVIVSQGGAGNSPVATPIDRGSAAVVAEAGSAATGETAAGSAVAEAGSADAGSGAGSGSAVAGVPMITLRFAVEPRTATITIDGLPIKGAEYAVRADDATHKLRITAPGHIAHAEQLRFDQNQKLSMQLKRVTKPGKPGKPGKPVGIEDESPYK